MKKIFIPWQLFRQTLGLRTKDNLESWLSRWRYGDDGAILIGGAMSLNEDTANPSHEQNVSRAATHAAPTFVDKLVTLAQRRINTGLPVDLEDRATDYLHEL